MQTVIGLGQAGCNIADQLKQYSQYKIIKIDTELKKTKTSFGLKHQTSPELYEEKLPRGMIKTLQEEVMPETLFITSCGMVSGASLSILEKIKDKTDITVMYIVPKAEEVAGNKKLQNNLLFNVFQQYARSNLLKRVYLLPLMKYWDTLNNLIAYTYHMINVFEHTKPMLTTVTNRIDTARMSTIGLLDVESNEEKMFFSLDIPREKNYYYGVPKKQLEEDENLMETIQNNVKNTKEHDKMKTTYSVYSTDYDKLYASVLRDLSRRL